MASWIDTLKKLAPTVASALGGPLAGTAVMALGELFGVSEPTHEKVQAVIEQGRLTGEQIAGIKTLELKLQAEERERGFRYAELEFKDRESARLREVQTGDKVNRNLAYFIVISFVGVVGTTLAGLTVVDSVLAGTLIGYLSAKAEQVLSYYFGSSQGSKDKTTLLSRAEPVKPEAR